MKQKVRHVSSMNIEKSINKVVEEEAQDGWVLKQISGYSFLQETALLLFEKPENKGNW